jgi:hypothetical protein
MKMTSTNTRNWKWEESRKLEVPRWKRKIRR